MEPGQGRTDCYGNSPIARVLENLDLARAVVGHRCRKLEFHIPFFKGDKCRLLPVDGRVISSHLDRAGNAARAVGDKENLRRIGVAHRIGFTEQMPQQVHLVNVVIDEAVVFACCGIIHVHWRGIPCEAAGRLARVDEVRESRRDPVSGGHREADVLHLAKLAGSLPLLNDLLGILGRRIAAFVVA